MKDRAEQLRNEGLSYREIGRQLGVSDRTIRYWLNPASKEQKMQYDKSAKGVATKSRYNQSPAGRACQSKYDNSPHGQIKRRQYRRGSGLLKRTLRRRLYNAIKGQQKSGSAVSDLGCSIEELKTHLEQQFQPGMSWENYGQWHIDHIIPLASFDLEDREELLQACHYSNLQPLWAEDNLRKGDSCVQLRKSSRVSSVASSQRATSPQPAVC